MSFLYRLECDIAEEELDIGAPHGTGLIRSVANIISETLRGPEIEASVLLLGGADWATVIEGTHVTPPLKLLALITCYKYWLVL